MKYRTLSQLLALLTILAATGCATLKNDITPHAGYTYHSLNVKVNVKATDTGKGQNFKILLKYDHRQDKMLFLSPLNQVFGALYILDEDALLINTKEKKYWRGRFNDLIRHIWGVDYDYHSFKNLVINGTIPPGTGRPGQPTVTLEDTTTNPAKTADAPETNASPGRIKIDHGNLRIKLKMYNHKSGPGRIDFSHSLKGLITADIDTIMSGGNE